MGSRRDYVMMIARVSGVFAVLLVVASQVLYDESLARSATRAVVVAGLVAAFLGLRAWRATGGDR